MGKWLNWTPPVKEKDSLRIKEDRSEESPHYFGMSPSPCTKQHRLELFWSILGDCIDDRKQFIFQCENIDEADELKKLTYTLVLQYSHRCRVNLDCLIIKASPSPP